MLVFTVDRGGDAIGLNDVHKAIATAVVLSAMLFVFGALNRTVHGGIAVFVGLIALCVAILFGAMYAANPELFPT